MVSLGPHARVPPRTREGRRDGVEERLSPRSDPTAVVWRALEKLRMHGASGLEVGAEEGDDAPPGVLGGGGVVFSPRERRDPLDPDWELRWVVVVEDAVSRVRIDLDVVLNADLAEHSLQTFWHLAHPGPPIPRPDSQ